MVYMPYNTKIQLAWLAGILDGEGSFMVIRSNRKGKYRYFYRISIANSNEIIINECKLILKRLGIKCCCYFQDRRGIKTIRRQTYLIHITNRDGIIKLCSAVVCYLIGKKRLGKRLLYIVTNWKKQKLVLFVEKNILVVFYYFPASFMLTTHHGANSLFCIFLKLL